MCCSSKSFVLGVLLAEQIFASSLLEALLVGYLRAQLRACSPNRSR
uniref:Uncharacterized protein n=1 Tax=Romanomermis culicivorax TaxID=13658 RepID=A0A915KH73_ROMCU